MLYSQEKMSQVSYFSFSYSIGYTIYVNILEKIHICHGFKRILIMIIAKQYFPTLIQYTVCSL